MVWFRPFARKVLIKPTQLARHVGPASQPLVTIYCDGEKRFSETITAKAPRPISLNVKDVGTLKIVVSSRNELDLHDHVTFAEARVSQ